MIAALLFVAGAALAGAAVSFDDNSLLLASLVCGVLGLAFVAGGV